MGVIKDDYQESTSNRDEHDKTMSPLLNNTASPQSDKSLIVNNPVFEDEEPVKDKFFIVYIIFLLFGIACLLPWNIFMNAREYFIDYKLKTNTSMNETYRNEFDFYVGLIGQTTNVIVNLINIFLPIAGNPKNRIPYAIILCAIVVIFQIAMAIIDTSTWPFEFFILCSISVLFMFTATGFMNSCVFYVSSIFPMEYTNAIVLGNNLAGIFTSVVAILSKLITPNLRLAAIYYFLAGFIVEMLAFIGYFLMHRTEYYKYCARKAEETKRKNALELQAQDLKQRIPYLRIIKKTGFLLFCLWLNFFSTLAIFPIFQTKIQQVSDEFIISKSYFIDILTFLTFNIAVTVGNMIPKIIRVPGPRLLPIPVITRAFIVFVFFSLCNYRPDLPVHIPILIKNDYVYWLGSILSPLFFGYFTSLIMMYAPRLVPEHGGTVAMMGGLTIAVGVMTGIQFSPLFGYLVARAN